jgi:hypothetical protein
MSFQPPPGGYGPPPGSPPPGGQPPGYPSGGMPFGQQPGYVPPPGYGSPAPGVAPQYGGMGGGGPKTELMAIISLVAGIVSIPAHYCCYMGVPIGIASIILAILSIMKINKEPQSWTGKGLAFGGIAATVLGFLIIAAILIVYGAALFMMKP